jgi:hypothetical protein
LKRYFIPNDDQNDFSFFTVLLVCALFALLPPLLPLLLLPLLSLPPLTLSKRRGLSNENEAESDEEDLLLPLITNRLGLCSKAALLSRGDVDASGYIVVKISYRLRYYLSPLNNEATILNR